jgi:hypothetical protein
MWHALVILRTHYEVDLKEASKGYVECLAMELDAIYAAVLEPATILAGRFD